MVVGRLNKELKVVYQIQVFIKDSEVTIGKLIEKVAKEVASPIKVSRMVRYEVGEGIEKEAGMLP